MPARKHPSPPVGTHAWLRWFRSQAPWKRLRAQVIREEPTCWLRLPGCTTVTTTADHIIPASRRPELALTRSNVHGACHNCNSTRSDKHAFDPALRRPKPPPSTATALRRIVANRRNQPRTALQFFNNGSNNGRIARKNGDHPPKQWRPPAPIPSRIRTPPTK